MNNDFPTKELIIAVVERDDSVLMRKKPDGSPPYKETWYSFGRESIPDQDNPTTIRNYLKEILGIDVEVDQTSLSFANETKADHDGIEKNFIYINLLCKYLGGDPKTPEGSEQVKWIPKNELKNYDIVPPSVKLLKGLGYIN